MLAGPLRDADVQQLLEQSEPAADESPAVDEQMAAQAAGSAWDYLHRDLAGGRWTQLHRRASITRVPGAAGSDSGGEEPAAAGAPGSGAPAPAIVDVVILWAGTSPAGEPADLRRNVVRLARSTTPDEPAAWEVLRLS